MTKTVKNLLIISGAIALALTIPSAQRAISAPKDEDLFGDPIIAKGKNFQIKRSQLENAFIGFKANAAAVGEKVPEENRDNIEAELFNELILTKILVQKASDADKAKAQASAKELIDKVKSRSSSDTIFKLRLKALGLTPEEFENQVLEQELRKEVVKRELASKITVSDADIKKFYDENPAEFEQPEKVRAAHILLTTIDKESKLSISDDKKREKFELAKKLKARAESGEDFAKLAKEFSEDPGSREKGGEYTFARGEMVAPFEKAAFSLRAGQISDIVETQFGYHVIKLLEKLPAKKESLADATSRISEYLKSRQLTKQLPAYYEQLKKDWNVEILDSKLSNAVAQLKASGEKKTGVK